VPIFPLGIYVASSKLAVIGSPQMRLHGKLSLRDARAVLGRNFWTLVLSVSAEAGFMLALLVFAAWASYWLGRRTN